MFWRGTLCLFVASSRFLQPVDGCTLFSVRAIFHGIGRSINLALLTPHVTRPCDSDRCSEYYIWRFLVAQLYIVYTVDSNARKAELNLVHVRV
jgi:hypothetical protein